MQSLSSADIVARIRQGETLQSIGDSVGLTRERIRQMLIEKGLVKPFDKSLLPPGVLDSPRQKPLVIPGKPVSEIIIEQRGPR